MLEQTITVKLPNGKTASMPWGKPGKPSRKEIDDFIAKTMATQKKPAPAPSQARNPFTPVTLPVNLGIRVEDLSPGRSLMDILPGAKPKAAPAVKVAYKTAQQIFPEYDTLTEPQKVVADQIVRYTNQLAWLQANHQDASATLEKLKDLNGQFETAMGRAKVTPEILATRASGSPVGPNSALEVKRGRYQSASLKEDPNRTLSLKSVMHYDQAAGNNEFRSDLDPQAQEKHDELGDLSDPRLAKLRARRADWNYTTVELIKERYQEATHLSPEDAPYAFAALDIVGTLADPLQASVPMIEALFKFMDDPRQAPGIIKDMVVGTVQSINPLEANISGPERFKRSISAVLAIAGLAHSGPAKALKSKVGQLLERAGTGSRSAAMEALSQTEAFLEKAEKTPGVEAALESIRKAKAGLNKKLDPLAWLKNVAKPVEGVTWNLDSAMRGEKQPKAPEPPKGYDPASVDARAKQAKGGDLTPTERTNLAALTAKVQSIAEELKLVESAGTRARVVPETPSTMTAAERLKHNYVYNEDRLAAALAKKGGGPEVALEIAGAYVEAGYRNYGRFMKELKATHPEVANRFSPRDWRNALAKAKAESISLSARTPVEATQAQGRATAQLQQARSDRAQAIGTSISSEQAELTRVQRTTLARIERLEGPHARKELEQAYAREGAEQSKARGLYDSTYRRSAGYGRTLQEANRTLAQMAKEGVDAADLDHQSAVSAVVGDMLDRGAQPQDVMAAMKKRLPNASPGDLALLVEEAARRYRGRFDSGVSVVRDYLKRGSAALHGRDTATLNRELAAAQRRVDAQIESLKPLTVAKRADRTIKTIQDGSPVGLLTKGAGNVVQLSATLLKNPLEVPASYFLDHFLHQQGKARVGLITPSKLRRIFDGFDTSVNERAREVLAGSDADSLANYKPSNPVTRATGLVDVPFKEFYTRLVVDDMATFLAKERLGKGASRGQVGVLRDKILRQLQDPSAEKILADDQVNEVLATAQDVALRKTFGADNFSTQGIKFARDGVKKGLARYTGDKAANELADALGLILERGSGLSRRTTNVILDRANYSPPAAFGEAAARVLVKKLTGSGFTPAEARLITDLTTKGLTGLALVEVGRQLVRSGKLQLGVGQTKDGTPFAEFNGLEQMGSVVAPVLYGAALERSKQIVGSPEVHRSFVWNSSIRILGAKSVETTANKVAQGPKGGAGLAADVIARNAFPDMVRDWAVRQDSILHGKGFFGERPASPQGFLQTLVDMNTPWLRDRLPSGGTPARPRP